jgi:hypothetical protein
LGGSWFQGLGQKVSQQTGCGGTLACGPSYMDGIGRRIAVQDWSQAKNIKPYPKNK